MNKITAFSVTCLASLNVFATTFVCSFPNRPISVDFKSEIEITRQLNGRYEMSGDDGTNPFDCFHSRTNTASDTYVCESYQGSYYGKIYLPRGYQNITKITFNYVDEGTGAMTRSETIACSRKN